MKFSMIILFFSFSSVINFVLVQSATLEISKFGGKPNTNIAKALTSAWAEACASTSAVKIVIPSGTYQMTHVDVKGPCKAPIEIQLDGTIKAPPKPEDVGGDQLLRIGYVNALTISGKGVIDGQGSYAWKQNDCSKNTKCKLLGMNLGFNFINNSIIRGITTKDSKHFHVNVLGCNNFTFDGFKVSTPGDSANTDGIHIGRSTGVNILNTDIATGDDCVSLGDGSRQVLVQNVKCGPGHGISIGSLGKYKEEESVDGITIKGCTLKGTTNGVRIKTWPNEPGTITVTNMRFEDITMDNVMNPIIIDQEYCPWNQCSKQNPSKIKISKVIIKDIKGTSGTKEGIILACSSGVPCEGVEISNVDLTFKGAPVIATCSNVKPKITGKAPACSAPSTKKE
ncbi:galacturan 1 [Vigna unguiculata]|uniref:Galacturan 1 n=1 Tax=Vigna unguiculata TaxID=3917 RepID=A0A4D6N4Y0_VIGUN|nr:galacturan 1 [Vigna unguiculata]